MTQEEFTKLVDKYLAGNASPLEERIINDFFSAQESKANLPEGDVSEEMWYAVENQIRNTPALRHSPSGHPKKSKRKKWVLLSLVVSFVFGLSAWYMLAFGWLSTPNVELLTSTSSRGQKLILTMNDGSRVYLNSSSTLTYPTTFPSDKREVFLDGEAFFEVIRNENRPFLIHSGNITTRVLGTSFNVNAFDADNISVSVASGKVQVDVDDVLGTSNPSKSVVLLPDQQAIYNKQSGLTIASIDIERFIAWKNNTLHFEDASLQEVAVVLERWYNVTIEFDDPRVKKCRINGQYKKQPLIAVLKSIQYMYKINYEFREGNKLKLYGKGC